MSFAVICAVNDRSVLNSCLLKSPDITADMEVSVQEKCASASAAYNRGIDATKSEIMIFVHQDVYLPTGWFGSLQKSLFQLSVSDPNWGVLGVWGVTANGSPHGWIYSSGLGRVLGGPFPAPQQIRTLDEVLLVVRRSSGLRFDESLEGFHMYATDVCLEAERKNLRNYAISCFLIHNSNGIKNLPWVFWKACLHVRKKWSDRLPIHAPCAVVSRFPLRTGKQMVQRFLRFSLKRQSVGRRAADPAAVYNELVRKGATGVAL